MKRAKILLSAIAVFAIVGSALAFKANKAFDGDFICRPFGQPSGVCPADLPQNHYSESIGGQTHFCNNGAGGTNCFNQKKVVQRNN